MVLKTISLILSFLFVSIGLFGCQQNNEEKVVNASSNTEGIEKVNIFEMKSFSKVNEKSLIVITDSEEINSIEEAFKSAEKVAGIVDVTDPQYQVEIGEKTYFLWLYEESGSIMDAKDTHTIYRLSNKSVKEINELITSKFGN
jgi:phosphotransferase system IIB component